MYLAAAGRAFPENYYSQSDLLDTLRRLWVEEHFNQERLERLHRNVLVDGRYLALSVDEYEALETWGDANNAWIRVAPEVGARAITAALKDAGLEASDIDALFAVTVTGVATPSLDAKVMNRLDMRSDVKRVPIFGLGCVGGAAGIARAVDYVRAFPDQIAVLLSVELCSLTVQRGDLSVANLIATGLFGDGGAAVVVAGAESKAARRAAERGRPRALDTRATFYRDSEHIMGWDVSEKGFGIILSADVPKVAENRLRPEVDAFLADHDLTIDQIETWIAHPGGPRVLNAMEASLDLPEDALELTWKSLRHAGNLSSSSVLMVLRDTLDQRTPAAGSYGLLLALGPGFCAEQVLLQY
ncbi:MAG: 3-oxoacyl-[acyl-carrier-protein] synthase III C-terminal domain-containing protein [Acidobacteriota bacterium]